jgi:hypothetical protein
VYGKTIIRVVCDSFEDLCIWLQSDNVKGCD